MNEKEKYSDLEWELEIPWETYAYHGYEDDGKEIFFYNESLSRIKAINPEYRHPYPWEVFGLIIDSFEKKLPSNYMEIVKNMKMGGGEWLNMAFLRKKNNLEIYFNPKNLKWDHDAGHYKIFGKLEYSRKEIFDISKIARMDTDNFIELKHFPQDFVKRIYGRKFEELPAEMSSTGGLWSEKIMLPPNGKISLMSTGYSINSLGPSARAASRGVRKKSSSEMRKYYKK